MGTPSCQQEDTHASLSARHVKLAKKAWRRWAKATRARLPLHIRSTQVCEVLASSSQIARAEHILAYLPTAHELDIRPLLTRLQQQGKQVYVTRTWPRTYTLTVHLYAPDTLEQHPYGYWQPPAHTPVIPPQQLDLVFVPGLCFDKRGQRLGYGAGYFDRLLARCDATTIGITCSELLIQHVPCEATDVPMDTLATEKGLLEPPITII